MITELTLTLPRDAGYVRLMRAVARSMLAGLGVAEHVIDDVELALDEACSNAVRHAVGSSAYEVTVGVDHHGCSIEVVDGGPGFTLSSNDSRGPVNHDNEHGHGLALIDALVDEAHFDRRADGMAVQLWKGWPQPGLDGQLTNGRFHGSSRRARSVDDSR